MEHQEENKWKHHVEVDGSNMWRKHAWTNHARYAEIKKKHKRVRQDKWTRQGDVFMSPVFKIPPNLRIGAVYGASRRK
ncbi:hypothetical protein F2Q68_00026289 [Brassica cretica]|uniref:Uncharacterized protein n=1 Tax=Brassica cretica TaxID=69181 RepID=A0A8S9IG60_BRACR|nr:hypothetical protein F2Q68_00026289 [Brassica cretica]